MKDEGAPHAQYTAEKAGFEDDVVSRRSLAAIPRSSGRTGVRPVVFGEDESGKVDLVRKLDKTLQRGRSRIERSRPV